MRQPSSALQGCSPRSMYAGWAFVHMTGVHGVSQRSPWNAPAETDAWRRFLACWTHAWRESWVLVIARTEICHRFDGHIRSASPRYANVSFLKRPSRPIRGHGFFSRTCHVSHAICPIHRDAHSPSVVIEAADEPIHRGRGQSSRQSTTPSRWARPTFGRPWYQAAPTDLRRRICRADTARSMPNNPRNIAIALATVMLSIESVASP